MSGYAGRLRHHHLVGELVSGYHGALTDRRDDAHIDLARRVRSETTVSLASETTATPVAALPDNTNRLCTLLRALLSD